MLNYKRKYRYGGVKESIKNSFYDIKINRIFWYTFFCILIKSILFLVLISDDKANGINPMKIFYSVPPFLVYFSFIISTLSFSYIFKGRVQLWSFFTTNLLITTLYIGDIWYYRSNSSFLNFNMLQMMSNLDNLGSSILSMTRLIDILFIVDLVFQIVISIRYMSYFKKIQRNISAFLILLFVPIIYLTYAHYKIDNLDMGFENQMIFKKSWSPNQTMSNLTPIGYHLFDLYTYREESKAYTFSESEKKEIALWFQNKREFLPDNEYKGIFAGKNLLMIQWESLENFVVNQKVDNQEITPTLNRILSNSIYFNNFYEETYNGTSSDGELITQTSVFPVREGATFFRYPYNTYNNSLPNIMKRLGYTTLASHPDKGSYWNWMPALKSIGFERCLDSSNYDIDEVINLGISDRSYLKQFGDEVRKLKAPFYAYTVTLTSHAPFNIPESDKELKLNEELSKSKLGGYFESIRYTDKYIGQLLESLDSSGVLDNTVVVIYGDHEGVHKFYDDEIKKINFPGNWWKENNRKVPLIIYSKGLEGKKVSVYGGQSDTLPTLAYLFGASKDEYENKAVGRNLLNTRKNYVVLSTREYLGEESVPGEKGDMLKAIDLCDKLIRGNYFKD
ncbi:phosphoglycerol transferase [Clostridium polyendosporum]|uniref:Phosphoglycerol transferase n=1 Tax=Clostridium polyendosporum TaxID=69208 RepID=A0A919VGI4_9CLOT|nr:LTA synthase family protein [Clostridium polyendosporum]GIM28666.1 phosphoglycerol transferase [Clostridium polyendosporum]